MGNRCVFLDRDNTLIKDPGYLTDPEAVRLLPGVDLALKSLAQAGYKLVVVTNQSAIARGLLTEEGLERVHGALRSQLAERGVELDAIYYCPYHPEGTVEQYARESQDRKTRPGMLLRAAAELDIELTRSWMVGDSARDIEAGQRAGCRTIRIAAPASAPAEPAEPAARGQGGDEQEADAGPRPDFTARNLVEAARIILREDAGDRDKSAEEGRAGVAAGAAAGPVRTAGEMSDSEVLREILRHVRRIARSDTGGEFSVSRLVAAIFQILAILALGWGLFYVPSATSSYESSVAWHVAMVTAGVLQLVALTFFVISGLR